MYTPSFAFLSKFKSGNYSKKVKIEILDKAENLLEEITPEVIDANISVDGNADIRRTFSLIMKNINNKFTPGLGNLIWYDKKIKPYTGIVLHDGTTEWVCQGVFLLVRASCSVGVGQIPTTRIECQDKMYGWGTIDKTLNIASGANIATTIQLVLDGIESKFIFDDCTYTVPYDLNYNVGTEVKQIVKDLANMITWDIGYDISGYLRFKPQVTDFDSAITSWEYKHEDYTLYKGSEKQFDDSSFANKIVVCGGSSQSGIVSSVISDSDVLSPFSTVNIGTRTYYHNNGSPDPMITDQIHADSRGQYELIQRLQMVESQRITMIPNFLHDYGDIISLNEPDTETNSEKYQLLRFNIPFGIEQDFSGECWRIRRLI